MENLQQQRNSLISALLEKILLNRIKPHVNVLNFQFKATAEQIHRVVANIERAAEGKRYCQAIFIDVAQAFDKLIIELGCHLQNETPDPKKSVQADGISPP